MITRIILKNFMAHAHTEIELGKGVTALTGPNNTGKSAVVEGLRCVITNPSVKYHIRHGAREARVTVVLEDGTRIVWIRKKASAGYELWMPGAEEPEAFWKLGKGGVPDEVRAALRLDMVELETGQTIDVHIGNQREPIFLLNLPGSAAAAFFAASTEGSHLLAMQNLLKRRVTEARKGVKTEQARLLGVESELDKLAPLPEITLRMDTVRKLKAALEQFQKDIPALEQLLSNRKGLTAAHARLENRQHAMQTMVEPPALHDLRPLKHACHEVAGLSAAISHAEKARQSMDPLAEPPLVYDTGALMELIERHGSTNHYLNISEKIGAMLTPLAEPPVLIHVQELDHLERNIRALRLRSSQVEQSGAVLADLSEPPELFDGRPLNELLFSMAALANDREHMSMDLEQAEVALANMEQTIAARVAEIGDCPLCGARLDAANFADKGCNHQGGGHGA